jgi:hypothetical protein
VLCYYSKHRGRWRKNRLAALFGRFAKTARRAEAREIEISDLSKFLYFPTANKCTLLITESGSGAQINFYSFLAQCDGRIQLGTGFADDELTDHGYQLGGNYHQSLTF